MPQVPSFFALQGGLDMITPAVVTKPGHLIAAKNYEPAPRGYRRIDGYERFDGRPKPSEASYWVLRFDAGSVEVEEDDIVTGGTSGATGRAVIDGVVESGSYGGGDAAGYLVLMAVSGTFQDDEDLEVSASKVAEADGTASERAAATDANDSTWWHAAIEKARAAIQKPSGSGPVRGVWQYGGETWAFRDNAGGTAGVLHKATAAGWVAQSLGNELYFSGGTAAFEEGETVAGGTSGASALIKRVVVQSGDWSTNDAAGKLIIGTVTSGPFQASETITSAGGSAAAVGAEAAITIAPGGRFDFINHNFYGSSNLERMYGCNGEGRAFEWDGAVFVPIDTGMATDEPTWLAAHRNHLFLAFPGGSLQNSSLGEPYVWEVVTGAAEIGIGEEMTGLLADVSGALAIFGRGRVAVLLGDDADNWVLNTLADDAGAVAWTAQKIGLPLYLDAAGLRSLDATDAYGDFKIGTKTRRVEPLFGIKARAGVTPVGSVRVRSKDQYRLFWSDGSGISVYFGRKEPEIIPFDLGFAITCISAGEDADGNEAIFIGDADGMVYQLDAGTSFDGEPVPAFVRLPFTHLGSPDHNKRFHKAMVEMDGGPSSSIAVVAEFSYADPDQPAVGEQSFDVRGGGGFWDEMIWDSFYWSSPVEGTASADIDGIGTNISVAILSNATYEQPHTLHGMRLRYSVRGLAR